MENGKWKMENGKWKMENGKWKMENGKWKMACSSPLRAELQTLESNLRSGRSFVLVSLFVHSVPRQCTFIPKLLRVSITAPKLDAAHCCSVKRV
jgi:hypothetical protein